MCNPNVDTQQKPPSRTKRSARLQQARTINPRKTQSNAKTNVISVNCMKAIFLVKCIVKGEKIERNNNATISNSQHNPWAQFKFIIL